MSLIVFSAVGFVFVVNADNGKVAQFTALEAMTLGGYFSGLAAKAMIDLVLTYNEMYLDEANELIELSEAFTLAALESM